MKVASQVILRIFDPVVSVADLAALVIDLVVARTNLAVCSVHAAVVDLPCVDLLVSIVPQVVCSTSICRITVASPHSLNVKSMSTVVSSLVETLVLVS